MNQPNKSYKSINVIDPEKHFPLALVEKIVNQANLKLSTKENAQLRDDFDDVLALINQLQTIETTTHQSSFSTSELENIFREDEVDNNHSFSQHEALLNAPRTYNGYFVVDRILEDN